VRTTWWTRRTRRHADEQHGSVVDTVLEGTGGLETEDLARKTLQRPNGAASVIVDSVQLEDSAHHDVGNDR